MSLWSRARLRGGSEAVAEHPAQFGAVGDAELGKYPVQVRSDRAVGEEQPLSDLAVGETLGRHQRNLQLLWRELVGIVRRAAAGGLTGGPQLLARALGPRHRAEGLERLAGAA